MKSVKKRTTAKKKSAPKKKKLTILLSEKEVQVLRLYAEEHGLTKPAAVRRVLREQLAIYAKSIAAQGPKNQLDLFASVQTDIFDALGPDED